MIGFRGGIIGVGTDIGKFWFKYRFSICSQLQADLSGSLQRSISCMVCGHLMEDCHMARWPTQWRGKRLCTACVDH
jgi:hypothetical protein